jgi:CubicO group peptidase (beta-lactamase class C family)
VPVARGEWEDRFAPVVEAFDEVMAGDRGGAAIAVYHEGRPVVDAWTGTAHPDGRPWERDTLAVSFSTTKGVSATALHQCVDRGLCDYDDPVVQHWPEFASHGKDAITIRHVLCHEAGLYDVLSLLESPEQLLDWDAMVHALEGATPSFEPGTQNGYHAVTFGYLVGEIVRRVSGRTITDAVQQDIAQPLGLDGCHIGLPAAELDRLAELIAPPAGELDGFAGGATGGPPGSAANLLAQLAEAMGVEVSFEVIRRALGDRDTLALLRRRDAARYPIPAANGSFTARSLARLYACLGAGGELDGVRLLSAETLARATAVQNERPDVVIVFPLQWRLGYHLVFTTAGSPPRAFGHNGFGGSGAWADPDSGLACAMTLNALSAGLQGDPRFMAVGGAALRCANAVPGASLNKK